MSDTSRKKAIENLETLKAFLDINGVFTISDAMKKSIDFAIASLKTDEAYQLEYERTTKNDLAVSSGLENGSPIIDWNNCHTPEQLDSIATPKNDLGVDFIDRQATLDAIIKKLGIKNETYLLEAERFIYQQILAMPSVTPQEPRWIPVSERLPELDENLDTKMWKRTVMITGYISFDDKKELFVSEAFINDVINNSVHDTVVTAWMSKPQPYKAESEVDNGNDD